MIRLRSHSCRRESRPRTKRVQINRVREVGTASPLPSPREPLRVVGRGKGWGAIIGTALLSSRREPRAEQERVEDDYYDRARFNPPPLPPPHHYAALRGGRGNPRRAHLTTNSESQCACTVTR